MESVGLFILILLFFLLSIYFSSIETAFTSLTPLQVEQLSRQGNKGKILSLLNQRVDKLLTAILIGNNVANISCSTLASIWTYQSFGSAFLGLSTGVMILSLVIFAELIPKRISLFYNTQVIMHTIYITYMFFWLLRPLQEVIYFLATKLTFFLKVPPQEDFVSLETLNSFLSIAHSRQFFNVTEHRLLDNLSRIKADKITAQQILTHRRVLISLNAEKTLLQEKELLIKTPFNKLLLYQDKKENLCGYAIKAELLRGLLQNPSQILKKFQHKLRLIPTSQSIYQTFHLMQKEKLPLVGVINEYSEISGIITLSDLVEQFMGTLDGENAIQRLTNKEFSLDGDVSLSEFNRYFNTNFTSKTYTTTTIGGYLSEYLGRIPDPKERVLLESGIFLIDKVQNNRIQVLRYRKTT